MLTHKSLFYQHLVHGCWHSMCLDLRCNSLPLNPHHGQHLISQINQSNAERCKQNHGHLANLFCCLPLIRLELVTCMAT